MPEGPPAAPIEERDLVARPIRDLGLRIEGEALEPVVAAVLAEVDRLGLPFRPRLYLSTEWGVPMGTIAIAPRGEGEYARTVIRMDHTCAAAAPAGARQGRDSSR